jgi:hypothetical protein
MSNNYDAAGRCLWRWSFAKLCETCCGESAQGLVCVGLFQRTSHSTTDYSGSCSPIEAAVISCDVVASAAGRRQLSFEVETHRRCLFRDWPYIEGADPIHIGRSRGFSMHSIESPDGYSPASALAAPCSGSGFRCGPL